MNEKSASVLKMDAYRDSQSKNNEGNTKPDLFQGFVSKLPPIPNGINKEARKHWNFIGKKLVAANMLCEVDIGQFQILCQTWALYVEAAKMCDTETEFQKTPNKYVQLAPWAVARDRHATRYQRIADKFFLSPRARKSVDIINPTQGSLDLD